MELLEREGVLQPPAAPAAEPFARELAGHWQAGCGYHAALARLNRDAKALGQALATFEALGARPAAKRAHARLPPEPTRTD